MQSKWLLVAGCWLLVAGCWLLVAGCRRTDNGRQQPDTAIATQFVDDPSAVPRTDGITRGRRTENVVPSPNTLCTLMSPPSCCVSRRVMLRPKPVPPYDRVRD